MNIFSAFIPASKLFYLQLQLVLYVSTAFSLNLTDGDVVRMPLVEYNTYKEYGEIEGAIYTVMPDSVITFTVETIPPAVHFILFQTHSHLHNVSLSYSQELTPHRYVNGTNLGLVQMMNATNKTPLHFFLHNENDFYINLFVAVQAYGKNVPVPGGCNMEFYVHISPYLRVSYDEHVVVLDGQPASVASDPLCKRLAVTQKVYHAYVTERDFSSDTYFAALRNMMSMTNISLYAQEISATELLSPLRRMYSAYSGTGSVHVMVATMGGYSSLYVPAFTYTCDPTTDSCDVLKTAFSKVLCALVMFVGLLMCFFGHTLFKTEMFLLGCISGSMVAHILLTIFWDVSYTVNIVFSLVLGAIFGALWLFIWCFCGIPILSVSLATLTLGFIFTATMFYAGIADYNFLQSDLNFWVLFSCLMLIISLMLIPSHMKANIVTCAVLGAYAFIIPVDYYVGSNLKYITINMIRRATVPDFKKAFIIPVFQSKDLILTFTWIGMALAGVMVQCCQQKNKAPFPPPPRQDRHRHQYRGQYRRSWMPRRTSRNVESRPLLTESYAPYSHERTETSHLPESPEILGSSTQFSKLHTYLSGLLPSRPSFE